MSRVLISLRGSAAVARCLRRHMRAARTAREFFVAGGQIVAAIAKRVLAHTANL